jgi:hypothetical protein
MAPVSGPRCLGHQASVRRSTHVAYPRVPGTPGHFRRDGSRWPGQCRYHRNDTHAGARHALANHGRVRRIDLPFVPDSRHGTTNLGRARRTACASGLGRVDVIACPLRGQETQTGHRTTFWARQCKPKGPDAPAAPRRTPSTPTVAVRLQCSWYVAVPLRRCCERLPSGTHSGLPSDCKGSTSDGEAQRQRSPNRSASPMTAMERERRQRVSARVAVTEHGLLCGLSTLNSTAGIIIKARAQVLQHRGR